ncbi:MAG: MBL fold metallo-hydrolase [Pedococcus sp.]
MTGVEVADGVVVVSVPMGPGLSTSVTVLSGERTVLVDAGTADGGPGAVARYLAGRRLTPIDTVVCTHFHHDHTGGLAEIAGDGEVDVFAHVAELGLVADPTKFTEAMSGIGVRAAPPTSHGVGAAAVLGGFELVVGGRTWEAVHVPGHTWGHLAMWSADERLLLAGDAVQGAGVPFRGTPGQGTGLPYYLDVDAYRQSIMRMRALAPETLVLSHENPSWDGRVLRGVELVREAFDESLAQVDLIRDRVRSSIGPRGASVTEIVEATTTQSGVGEATPQGELTVRAHLVQLRSEGFIAPDGGRWYPA